MPDRIYYSREAEQAARQRQIAGLLAFLTLGLGIGAAIALMFAPQEGSRTRDEVAGALEEGIRRGRATANDAVDQLESEFPDLRKKFDRLVARAESAIKNN